MSAGIRYGDTFELLCQGLGLDGSAKAGANGARTKKKKKY
jgi:hypothetical protein